MNRPAFLLPLALAFTLAASTADARLPEKPNIVFIVVDDMGYADLGCYGSTCIQTPNLDRMASEGIRFTDAYSGCTVCAPARSVLMTGKHMGHTSVRGNTGGIPLLDEDVTVAEVLKTAGYATGGFGKWGIGEVGTPGVPEKQGFDTFFGYYHQVHAHNFYTPYLWRNSEKVPLAGNDSKKRQKTYSHVPIARATLAFIRENKDRPFFCYAPWTPPHAKYQFPENDPAWQLYKDKPWPRNAKVIAAMDSMIDRQVGKILKLLKALDIDKKTIVFFCSDNGAALRLDRTLDSSGPLKGFKRSMYEGGIRVPMIAHWPGVIAPGQTSDLPWYFADAFPTFAELAGAKTPKDVDGISIVPTLVGETLAGRAQKKHEYLYWEFQRFNWKKRQDVPGGLVRAVRAGRWKGVKNAPDRPLELYDLSVDIGEKNNIASAHTEVVSRLESYLKKARIEPRPQIEPEAPRGRRFQ